MLFALCVVFGVSQSVFAETITYVDENNQPVTQCGTNGTQTYTTSAQLCNSVTNPVLADESCWWWDNSNDTRYFPGDTITSDSDLTLKLICPKFTVNTANDERTFSTWISASGEFYIDCGEGGNLSIIINRPYQSTNTGERVIFIDKQNTDMYEYKCDWENGNAHTIKYAGLANGYRTIDEIYSAAIMFYDVYRNSNNSGKISTIEGSLGSIFKTLNDGSNDLSKQPRFLDTFRDCNRLTSLPADLFKGISGAAESMFMGTFVGCSGLTSLPTDENGNSTLFKGVYGNAEHMFGETFADCTGLESLPADLFKGVSSAANEMFVGTFAICSGLTSIPDNLFGGISGNVEGSAFNATFVACTNLKKFSHNGVVTNPDEPDYIPYGFFNADLTNTDNIDATSSMFNNTQIATSCPVNMYTHYIPEWLGEQSDFPQVMCDYCGNVYSHSDEGANTDEYGCYATVNFVTNNETTVEPERIYYGDDYSDDDGYNVPEELLPQDLTKDGFELEGWYTSNDFSGDKVTDLDDFELSGDITLYARWVSISCQAGEYLENGECKSCPSAYPYSAAGITDSAYCYNTKTVACGDKNPYLMGHGTATYTNANVTCKDYLGVYPETWLDEHTDNMCTMDSVNACEYTLACDTGYELTGSKGVLSDYIFENAFIGYSKNSDYCRFAHDSYKDGGGANMNYISTDCSSPDLPSVFNSLQSNEWRAEWLDGTAVYGTSSCQSEYPAGYIDTYGDAVTQGQMTPEEFLAGLAAAGATAEQIVLMQTAFEKYLSGEYSLDETALRVVRDLYAVSPANYTPGAKKGNYCWCKMTGYSLRGGNNISTSGNWWNENETYYQSADECAENCAMDCVVAIEQAANTRTGAFGALGDMRECSLQTYNITLKNENDTVGNSTYTYSVNSQTLDVSIEPTKDDHAFTGWCTTYEDITYCTEGAQKDTIDIPAGATGDLTYTAQWEQTGCPAGTYMEDEECFDCLDYDGNFPYSDAGATNGEMCYNTGNVSCALLNPYTGGHGTATYGNSTNGEASYREYADFGTVDITDSRDGFFLDRIGACAITSLNCDTGYYSNNTNGVLSNYVTQTVIWNNNQDIKYRALNGDSGSNSGDNGQGSHIGMNNGDWSIAWPDGTVVHGKSTCTSTEGTNPWGYGMNNGNIKESGALTAGSTDGQYCWCKMDGYSLLGGNNIAVAGNWVFYADYGAACVRACADTCAGFTQQSTDIRTALFGSLGENMRCETDTLKITFKNGDTTLGTANYSYNANEQAQRVPQQIQPTNRGHVFTGWCTTYNSQQYCTNGNNKNTITIPAGAMEPLTYYAQWELETYTITYEHLLGDNPWPNGANHPGTYTIESPNITISNPVNNEYVFSGWSCEWDGGDCSSIPNIPTGSTGNIILRAQYQCQNPNDIRYVDGNGNIECQQPEFIVNTVDDGGTFSTTIGASGTFYIDCGAGGNFNDSGERVGKIDKQNTNSVSGICSWESGTEHTIRYAGDANGYNPERTEISGYIYLINCRSAIKFSGPKIASISGSLGDIFPTLNDGSDVLSKQPQFCDTFINSDKLTSLPAELFDGIHGSAQLMFYGTFHGCSGLTSLPVDENGKSTLFKDISGSASLLFYLTFRDCTGLKSLPQDLFANVGSGSYTFANTFYGCTGLKSLPSGLFKESPHCNAGFENTFRGCTGLTSLPHKLFDIETDNIYVGQRCFNGTFADCTNLTTVPADLFSWIDNISSPEEFYSTFNGDKKLDTFDWGDNVTTSYIPPKFFGNEPTIPQHQNYAMYNVFNNTSVALSCPAGTAQYITGLEEAWNYPNAETVPGQKVSCAPVIKLYQNYSANDDTLNTTIFEPDENNDMPTVNINGEELLPPTRTAYVFLGYFNQRDGGTKYYNPDMTSAQNWDGNWFDRYISKTDGLTDSYLYAQWAPLNYRIRYYDGENLLNIDGEDPQITPNTYSYSDSQANEITPSEPQKEHYSFDGWCNNAELTGECSKTITIPAGTIDTQSFYAKWTPVQYRIEYNLGAGVLESGETNPIECSMDTQGITLNNPVWTGYEFTGWCLAGESCDTPNKNVEISACEGPRKYIANYDLKKYSITYFYGGDGPDKDEIISGIDEKYTYYTIENTGGNFKRYPDVDYMNSKNFKPGKEFVRWIDKRDNHEYTGVYGNAHRDIELYAVWKDLAPVPTTCGKIYKHADVAENPAPEQCYATVIYHLNNGATPITENIHYGDNNTTVDNYKLELPAPEYTGYIFQNWADANGNLVTNDTAFNNDAHLYAQWAPIGYDVTFNANGGVGDKGSVRCTYDALPCYIGGSGEISNEGYTFKGWSTNSADTEAEYNEYITRNFESDVTLYAIWGKQGYQVKYIDESGNKITGADNPVACDIETQRTELNNPERPYYEFKGWCISGGTCPVLSKPGILDGNCTKDITYIGHFEPIKYKVIYKDMDGSDLPEIGNAVKQFSVEDKGRKIEYPTSIAKQGYEFKGWRTASNGGGNEVVGFKVVDSTLGHDIIVYANWEPAPIDCVVGTYLKAGTTECIPCDEAGKYCGGARCIYSATEDCGKDICPAPYTNAEIGSDSINDCYKDCEERGQDYTYISGKNYYNNNQCIYNANTYAIVYKDGDDILDNLKPNTYTVEEYGKRLADYSKPHHVFAGWCESNQGCQYPFRVVQDGWNGEQVLYAQFTTDTYIVKYSCGTGTGVVPLATATYGQAFTVAGNTGCTRIGYDFDGWVDDSGNNRDAGETFVWEYESGKTFTAKWKIKTYTITYLDTNGEELPQEIINQILAEDKTYTIESNKNTGGVKVYPKVNRSGYNFNGWKENGSIYTGFNVRNRVASGVANITVYASWELAPIDCERGTYLQAGTTECTSCDEAGKYCGGARCIYSATEDCGKDICPAPYTNAEIGSDSINDCYKDCEERNGYTHTGYDWYDKRHADQCAYTPITYNIYYELNGGTLNALVQSPRPYTVNMGIITDLPTPGYEGGRFTEWQDEEGNRVESVDTSIARDITLYAQYTCDENNIEYTDDNGIKHCIPAKFIVNTVNDGGTFSTWISASGEFYIDCGEGGIFGETHLYNGGYTFIRIPASGKRVGKIEKLPSYLIQYTCQFASAGEHEIKYAGLADEYNDSPNMTAIRFSNPIYNNNNAPKIASISGSLSAIFPTLNNGSNDPSQQPQFIKTFMGCTGLTSLPIDENGNSTLFKDVFGATDYMFESTFSGCSGLASLPEDLFKGISGVADSIFENTFESCSNLKIIPDNLFNGISSVKNMMFLGTFAGCTGLTEIPANLFSNITGDVDTSAFSTTFFGCTNLKKFSPAVIDNPDEPDYIPYGFFSADLTNTDNINNVTDYMFYNTQIAKSCPANMYTHYIPDWLSTQSDFPQVMCDGCGDVYPHSVKGDNDTHESCYAIVTYHNGEDTTTQNVNYTESTADKYGLNELELPDVTKDGYKFTGWFTADGTAVTEQSEFTGDIDLYAQFARQITIHFDDNANGYNTTDKIPDDVVCTEGEECIETYIVRPPRTQGRPRRTGYAFDSWNTEANGTGVKFEYEEGMMPDNGREFVADLSGVFNLTNEHEITLYAQWTPLNYRIRYYDGEGEIDDIEPKQYVYSDEDQNITTVEPRRNRYAFVGWCDNEELTGDCQKTLAIPGGTTGPLTYYAKWEYVPFVCSTDKYLRFGEDDADKLCLSETKISGRGLPSLTFQIGNKKYYLGLTKDSNMPINETSTKKMRVLRRGVKFNAFDASVLQ